MDPPPPPQLEPEPEQGQGQGQGQDLEVEVTRVLGSLGLHDSNTVPRLMPPTTSAWKYLDLFAPLLAVMQTERTQYAEVLRKVMTYYYETKPSSLVKFLGLVYAPSRVSLRIIDWFTTNYSKKYSTVYSMRRSSDHSLRRFHVYNEYNLMLRSYKKRLFDPFCRHQRVIIPVFDPHGVVRGVETTVGQLNFFMWAIDNRVTDYINLDSQFSHILQDMNAHNSTARRRQAAASNHNTANNTANPGGARTRRRQELSAAPHRRGVKIEDVEVEVSFGASS